MKHAVQNFQTYPLSPIILRFDFNDPLTKEFIEKKVIKIIFIKDEDGKLLKKAIGTTLRNLSNEVETVKEILNGKNP